MAVLKLSPASRAKIRLALYLTAILSVGVQLVSAPAAFATVTAPTNGNGTCWRNGIANGTPKWCPKLWGGSPGVGAYMGYNFNDHTDEGCFWVTPSDPDCTKEGCDTGTLNCKIENERRTTWDIGIAAAGTDWQYRHNKNYTWTQAGYDSSPVWWDWSPPTTTTTTDVGFYHSYGALGYVGQTFIHRTTASNDYSTSCNEPMAVEFVRVRLNKRLLDGTPPWFFNTLVRHELGHVFGLCEARATSIEDDYKSSMMFAPSANDIRGCSGPPFLQSCHDQPLSSADSAQWPQYPPWQATATTSDPDFGNPACTTLIAGIRCIYGK